MMRLVPIARKLSRLSGLRSKIGMARLGVSFVQECNVTSSDVWNMSVAARFHLDWSAESCP